MDTGIQNGHSGIFSSGGFRTSEGSVSYFYMGVQIFHLDTVDLVEVLVWK
jgi:hypothetical protein